MHSRGRREYTDVVSTCAGDLERTLGDLEAMSNAAASTSGSESGQGTFGLIRSYIAFVRGLGQGSNLHVEVKSPFRTVLDMPNAWYTCGLIT